MSPLFCLRYPLPKPLDKLRYRTMQPFATYSTLPHPNPSLGEGLRGEGLATEVACSLRSVILSFVGDNQTVVSWLDMGGKLLAKLFVPGESVAQVGEPGVFRTNPVG